MKLIFKIFLFGILPILLIFVGFCLYAIGFVNGEDNIYKLKNFYENIDLQDAYACNVSFFPKNNAIIEKIGSYERLLFTNASNIANAKLGPDMKTLHLLKNDGKSVCVFAKTILPLPSNDDYKYSKIPDQNKPWDLDKIINHKEGFSFLPAVCSTNSIIKLNGTYYLVYLEIDEDTNKATLKIQNYDTGSEYLSQEIGKVEPMARWTFTPNINKGSTTYPWIKYAYPDMFEELADNYMFQFGPQLLTISKKDLKLKHSINLPLLGDSFGGSGCGGSAVTHLSDKVSNVILIGINYCEGLGYKFILDFNNPNKYLIKEVNYGSGLHSKFEAVFEKDKLKLITIKNIDVTKEVINDTNNLTKLCANVNSKEFTTIIKNYENQLNEKYPNRNANCDSFCYAGTCNIDDKPIIDIYNSTSN